jgi:hypothetical protein
LFQIFRKDLRVKASFPTTLALTLSTLTAQAQTAAEDAFKARVAGRYAHYDVVAYQEKVLFTEMKTYVITYGITELSLDPEGRLIAKDRYCYATHKSNLPFQSEVPDSFTQAIVPRTVEVQIRQDGEQFSLWRPETPTLIGAKAESPDLPLPTDPKKVDSVDDDQDGKPGVTVKIKLYNTFPTELYIARREIFAYALSLDESTGQLKGYVSDHSEQVVLGSPLPLLRGQRNPAQHPDLALSPMVLVPIDASYDCKRIKEERDLLFPAEPAIW